VTRNLARGHLLLRKSQAFVRRRIDLD
jgi:hypothetical protein